MDVELYDVKAIKEALSKKEDPVAYLIGYIEELETKMHYLEKSLSITDKWEDLHETLGIK